MFEYFLNGEKITADYISERARIANMSFEEYIKKNNIQRKSSNVSITEELKKEKQDKSDERSLAIKSKDAIPTAKKVNLPEATNLPEDAITEIKKAIFEPVLYTEEKAAEDEAYKKDYEFELGSKLQESFDIFEDKNITEESVVPKLNEKFGDLGFKFYQTGIGDEVKIKANSGNEIDVLLKGNYGEVDPNIILDENPYDKFSNFIKNNKSFNKKENKVLKEYGILKSDLESIYNADEILEAGAEASNMVNKILQNPMAYGIKIANIGEYDPSLQEDKLAQYSDEIKEAAIRNSPYLSSINKDIVNKLLTPDNLQKIFNTRAAESLIKKRASSFDYSPESISNVIKKDIDNLNFSTSFDKQFNEPIIKDYLKIGIEIDGLTEKFKNASNKKEQESILQQINSLNERQKNIKSKKRLEDIEFFSKTPYTKPDGSLASEEERQEILKEKTAEVNNEANELAKNKSITVREALHITYKNLVKDQFDRWNWGENNFITLDLQRGKLNYPEVAEYLFKNNKIDNKYFEGKVDLSYNDILNLKDNIFGFRPESQSNMIADNDKTKIAAYNDFRYYLANKKAALNNVYLKNIAVSEIGDTNNLQEFGRSVWRASGLTPTNELEYNSSSVRQAKDNVTSLISDYNTTYSKEISEGEFPSIQLTKEEEDALERTFGETLAESGGSFVPMIAEFAAINAITGGFGNVLGYTRFLNVLRTGTTRQKAFYHFLNLAAEEGKMQMVGMHPGGGASFYTLGALTSGVTPFKTKFKYLEPLWQKVIKAGPVGAASSEAAALTENAIDAMVNDTNFNDFLEKEYGDFSETTNRALANMILFSGMGITHAKKTDFMHTSTKVRAVEEINKKIKTIYEEAGLDGTPKEITTTEVITGPDGKEQTILKTELSNEEAFNKLPESKKRLVENLQEAQNGLRNLVYFERNAALLDARTEEGKAHAKKVIEQVVNSIQNVNPNKPLKVEWVEAKEMGNSGAKAEFDVDSNIIYLNKEAKDIATGLTHEVVHAALANYFSNNKLGTYNFNERLDNIIKNAVGEFTVGTGQTLTDFIKEKYNIKDLRNKGQKKTFNDEYLAYVAEMLTMPEVYNSNISGSLFKDIRQEIINFAEEKLNFKPTIRTGQDLVDFLGRYSSNLSLGKDVSKKIQRLGEIDLLGLKPSEKVIAERKASLDIREQIEKLEKQKEELEDSWYNQEIDNYEFEQKTELAENRIKKLKEALKSEGIKPLPKKPTEKKAKEEDLNSSIEKLMPKRNKENLYDISRVDWVAEESDKVAAELLKENGIVESLIRKELRRNGVVTDNVHGLGIEDFIAEVKSKVLKTIQDFNPELTPKAGESNLLRWIMGKSGIPNRVGDLANKLRKNVKTKDTGEEFNFRIEDEAADLFETEDLSIGAKPKTEKGETIIDPVKFFIKDENVSNEIKEKMANFLDEKEVFTGLTYKTVRQNIPSLFEKEGAKSSDFETKTGTIFSDTSKALFGKTEKEIKKFITDNAETLYGLLPKGAMKAPIDKTKSATGLEKTVLKNFYSSGERITMERELQSEAGGTYSGLKEQIKQPFNKNLFLETFVGKPGSTLSNKEKRAVNALARELEAGIKNKLARDYMLENKINQDIINRIADGKSERMASYIIDFAEAMFPKVFADLKGVKNFQKRQSLFKKTYKDPKNDKEVREFNKEFVEGIYVVLKGVQGGMYTSKEKFPKDVKSFLDTQNLTQEEKGKYIKLFEEELSPIAKKIGTKEIEIGEDKIKEVALQEIDLVKYEEAIKMFNELAEYFPNDLNRAFANALAGFHVYTNHLVTSMKDNIYISEERLFDKEGKVLPNLPENFRGKDWHKTKRTKKEIKEFYKNIDLKNVINNQDFKKALKRGIKNADAYLNKKGTNKNAEGKYITRQDNSVLFQIGLNQSYQLFLNNAKDKGKITEDYIRKVAFLYKIKEAQTHARGGEASLAKVIGYDAVALEKGKLNKTEHLKSLNQVTYAEMNLLLKGEYNSETGLEILKNYSAISGNKKAFDKIDALGKINTANELRLLKSPEKINDYVLFSGEKMSDLLKASIKSEAEKFTPEEQKKVEETIRNLEKILKDNTKLLGPERKALLKNNSNILDSINVLFELTKQGESTQGGKGNRMQSLDINAEFNKMLERKTGVDKNLIVSSKKAALAGKEKGKWDIFISPSAEDFMGLNYKLLGKGKQGDADKKFIEDHIYKPYLQGTNALATERVNTLTDFRKVKSTLKIKKSFLNKKVADTYFTKEHAARVYIWTKQGEKIPGLIDSDVLLLNSEVFGDPKLKAFADAIINLNKVKYPSPTNKWEGANIMVDLIDSINTDKRDLYLGRFKRNVDEFFSEDNLNKLESVFGTNYRKALEHSIKRMKTGKNLEISKDLPAKNILNWVRGSQAVTMFLNTRSAVLQTISTINYLNQGDNNPIKAGLAFANQPQYWKDFSTLWNSDYLVNRRAGSKLTIEDSDIADLASEKGISGFIAKGLKLGFTPTQIADSFAISTGGATFYRNRINTYLKQGLELKVAERKAFLDFKAATEESQQSADPARISQQQASAIGSVILAYANTPAQYARLTKKAILDIKNNRGSFNENIGNIIYYTTVQNLIFSYLQQGLFAAYFDDDESDTEENKKKQKNTLKIVNSMSDSFLRGMGWYGAAVSTLKNMAMKIYEESENKRPQYSKAAYTSLQFAPPIQSKVSLVQSALRTYEYEKDKIEKEGFSYDNPAVLANAKIFTSVTNIPLSRAIQKVNNIKASLDNDLETWQRIALIGGYPEWQIAPEKPKTEEEKEAEKEKKKAEKKEKKLKEISVWNETSYEEKQKIMLLRKQAKKDDEKEDQLDEYFKILAKKYKINY